MNFSQGFLENVALLVLTASITGFLIPYIFKSVDERKLKAQKEFDADLIRQGKIIESQIQLLEKLSDLFWEFQISAIAVSRYDPIEQRDLYVGAVNKYQETVADLITKIRSEISKALRLTTPETYQELKTLFYEQLINVDVALNELIEKQEGSEQRADGWYEFNQFAVFELSEMVDNTLNNLAKELRLKGGVTKKETKYVNVRQANEPH